MHHMFSFCSLISKVAHQFADCEQCFTCLQIYWKINMLIANSIYKFLPSLEKKLEHTSKKLKVEVKKKTSRSRSLFILDFFNHNIYYADSFLIPTRTHCFLIKNKENQKSINKIWREKNTSIHILPNIIAIFQRRHVTVAVRAAEARGRWPWTVG